MFVFGRRVAAGLGTCFGHRWAAARYGVLLLLVWAGPVQAQGRQWTAHTSMRGVAALSVSEDAVWAATTGGVFSYTPSTGAFRRFTAAEGLHNVQAQAVAYDARRGVVWIGYRDAVIDRLDVETGQVQTFFDIQRSDRFSGPAVNRLLVRGDSLLAATTFGLVIFDPVRQEVRDTYSQLGALNPAIPVRDVAVAPLPDGRAGLWLATTEGVAYAPLDAVNLQDPSVWSIDQQALPSIDTYALEAFDGALYVGTDVGLAVRQGDGTYTRLGFTDRTIFDLAPLPDRLLALDDFKLYGVFASGGASVVADGFVQLTTVAVGPGGNVWLGDGQEGLNAFAPPVGNAPPERVLSEVFPDGPFDGLFADLTVDEAGSLWAAAVPGLPGSGFYRLDPDGQWTNYTGRFVDALVGRSSFRSVHADGEGNLWAASFGNGLARVTPEGDVVVYDRTNSSLQPAAGTSDFLIIGGAASDKDGTLWVTNTTASQPLHVRTTDGAWTPLAAPVCTGLVPTTALGPIFIDSFGQKWITVLSQANLQVTRGLIVLDTGTSPTDASDDVCRFIGQEGVVGQGLPSTTITSVTEDREGQVWIGTAEGPAFILSSTVAARDGTAQPLWPQWADRADGVFVLSGLHVNDIAVDPSNRLWVGTNEGVYLLRRVEGGYERVALYTAEATPLFSNIVVSVTVDGRTGEVYLSTDQGLVSVQGDAVEASPRKRDLFVYPNPVQVTEGATPDIFIEGLVEETDVQVVAPHGEVVARFEARGGRARWDGRDMDRRLVPSGVYLIVAVGQNGEGTAYGKVAVIR